MIIPHNKFLFLFLMLQFVFYLGQSNRFIYEYQFISDSTQSNNVSKEVMFLDITKNESSFYSYRKYYSDSIIVEDNKKGIFSMPPNMNFINFRVLKKSNNLIQTITNVAGNTFIVSDNHHLNWKILNETDSIMNYKVIKAEVLFAGRKWIAWFTKEIPIQDGPYKFYGLPGLILQIEDGIKSHSFTIIGISKMNKIIEYPKIPNAKSPIGINQNDYYKLYRDYREDPLKNLRGKYPDQMDEEGGFKTGDQVFRENEKLFKDRIKNDNNIIEIDLLK
ncbi:GLPGLI family protein [Kaistella haifensis]|nr:GLPGLI family protein [Kaistella haifensis]